MAQLLVYAKAIVAFVGGVLTLVAANLPTDWVPENSPARAYILSAVAVCTAIGVFLTKNAPTDESVADNLKALVTSALGSQRAQSLLDLSKLRDEFAALIKANYPASVAKTSNVAAALLAQEQNVQTAAASLAQLNRPAPTPTFTGGGVVSAPSTGSTITATAPTVTADTITEDPAQPAPGSVPGSAPTV